MAHWSWRRTGGAFPRSLVFTGGAGVGFAFSVCDRSKVVGGVALHGLGLGERATQRAYRLRGLRGGLALVARLLRFRPSRCMAELGQSSESLTQPLREAAQ